MAELVGFVLASVASACLIVWAKHFSERLPLGWSIAPGMKLLLAVLIVLCYATLRRRKIPYNYAAAALLFSAAILLEKVMTSRDAWIVIGTLLMAASQSLTFYASRGDPILRWSQGALATYGTSVFFYNICNPAETMNFFGGGVVS